MKRIIFGLMLAMMFCTLVQGANRTVTENDGQGNKKRVIELRDTVINGETVTDTLSVMTYENGAGSSNAPEKWRTHHSSMDWNGFDLGSKTSETVIAVTAIVFVFGLPLLIIFVVFFFRYKNRKAKYRLAEQALASGQQLPENFFKEAHVIFHFLLAVLAVHLRDFEYYYTDILCQHGCYAQKSHHASGHPSFCSHFSYSFNGYYSFLARLKRIPI